MLMVLVVLVSISVLTLLGAGCCLIYKDCEERGISSLSWVLLLIITTPVFGGILYGLNCRRNNHKISYYKNKINIQTMLTAFLMLVFGSIGLAVLYS